MMNYRTFTIVIGSVGLGLLIGSQSVRADLRSLLGKAAAATTQPAPTTAPATQSTTGGLFSEAESLLGSPAKATTQPTTSPAAGVTAQARARLDQAIAYIKGNKLDLADKTLTQLEQQKASLPASLQSRLVDARAMLDAAKASNAAGIALPKL